LCEYVGATADACAPTQKAQWVKEQKTRLKDSRTAEVLDALLPHLEHETTSADRAPVQACYRYIRNRPGQFDYKGALDRDLPIGPGRVESSHRYVVQERLKLLGA
jgi:hypothetical protein